MKQKTHRSRLPNIGVKPWYDQECSDLKSKIKGIIQVLKHNPTENKIKENLHILRRQYKNTLKKKKRAYKERILNELNCTGKNSKLFWKTLNKLNNRNNDEIFKWYICRSVDRSF